MQKFMFFGTVVATFMAVVAAGAVDYWPPAGQHYAQIANSGSILPGGRVIQPWGTQLQTGPGTFGLAINSHGTAATADIGFERFGITVIERAKQVWMERHLWTRTPGSKAPETAEPDWKGVFFGIAFDTDKTVWVSEGDSGRIRLVDTNSGSHRKIVDLNGDEWQNSFTADMAFDATRHLLFVVDQANFRVAVVDTKKGDVISSVRVGRMPFAIGLSPDGGTAYVTNWSSVSRIRFSFRREPGGRETPDRSRANRRSGARRPKCSRIELSVRNRCA